VTLTSATRASVVRSAWRLRGFDRTRRESAAPWTGVRDHNRSAIKAAALRGLEKDARFIMT
jgi:hypothetical protein